MKRRKGTTKICTICSFGKAQLGFHRIKRQSKDFRPAW